MPEYRSDLAAAHELLSVIFSDSQLHRPQACLESVLAALAISRKLAADFPNRPEFRKTVATYLGRVAIKYSMDMQDPRKGEEYFRAALAAWQDIEKEAPNDPDVIREIAWNRWWFGELLQRSNRLQEAEPELRRALALREKLLAGSPGALGLLADHAHNKAYLARLLLDANRPAEAETLLREAIAFRERMIHDYPKWYDHWRRLVIERQTLGDCLLAMGRTKEAEETIRRNLAISQKLVADFPEAPANSYELAWAFYALGLLLQDTDRPQEAAEAFRDAKKLFEEAAAKFRGGGSRWAPPTPSRGSWPIAPRPSFEIPREPSNSQNRFCNPRPSPVATGSRWAWPNTREPTAGRNRIAPEVHGAHVWRRQPPLVLSWPWLTGNWATKLKPTSGMTRP